jgi:hypothetical protein
MKNYQVAVTATVITFLICLGTLQPQLETAKHESAQLRQEVQVLEQKLAQTPEPQIVTKIVTVTEEIPVEKIVVRTVYVDKPIYVWSRKR